jgi:hypothetical protein
MEGNMSSSSAFRLSDASFSQPAINIGELVEQAIKLNVLGRGSELEIMNAATDNFPFLLKSSGARDKGGFAKLWFSNSATVLSANYSAISKYYLRSSGSKKPIGHLELLGLLNLRRSRYATLREMLAIFDSAKAVLTAQLRRNHRLIALGNDVLNPYEATCLSTQNGSLELTKIYLNRETAWLTKDLFVLRSEPPTR